MLDWDDFSTLDNTTVVSIDLDEQKIALLLTALSFLERQTFENDSPDDRDEIISGVYDALSG